MNIFSPSVQALKNRGGIVNTSPADINVTIQLRGGLTAWKHDVVEVVGKSRSLDSFFVEGYTI